MKAAVHHCIVYNPPPLHRLEAYTLSNRGRSPRHTDSTVNPPPLHRLEAYTLSNRGRSPRHTDNSKTAGWKPVPSTKGLEVLASSQGGER